MSEDKTARDQAVIDLMNRSDAVSVLVDRFATGDVRTKKLVWACIREMKEGPRARLEELAKNRDGNWRSRIVTAARQILVKGFHQNLDEEQEAQSEATNAPHPTVPSSVGAISRDALALADALIRVRAIERAIEIAQGEATTAARNFHLTGSEGARENAARRLATARRLKKMLSEERAVADVLETALRTARLPTS